MKIKRIICLITAVVLVVSVLSACSLIGKASLPFKVDQDGKFIYAVVRAHDSTLTAEAGAKEVRAAIKDNFDVGVTIIRDSVVEDVEGDYEILVGDTNREESAIAKQRLIDNRPNHSYDFIVAVIGNKIAIQSVTDEILTTAVAWFTETFCQNEDTWSMLYQDYEFIYEYEVANANSTNLVNNVDLGTFTFVLPVKTSYLSGMYAEDIVDFYEGYGFKMKSIEDIDPEVQNEIIIGDTTRPESKAITVEGDNYVIKVVGGDVVIKGGSDLATWRATKAFYEEVIKVKTGNGIAWTDGYIVNGKYDAKEDGAMTLNWNDEFEGSSINLNKWGEYSGMINETETSGLGGFKCWQNLFGESPYNERGIPGLKRLIYQSDGNLHIGAQRLNEIDFVGGQISTNHTMVFRYGLCEIRSKLPPVPCSLGYWLNESGFGTESDPIAQRFGGLNQVRASTTEVDIIENFGSNTTINANVHRWWINNQSDFSAGAQGHESLDGGKYAGKAKNNKKKVYDTTRYEGDLSTDYHYYSVYWNDDFMKFNFDGKTFLDYRFDADAISVSPYCLMTYFITECQMGDASYGVTYDPDEHDDYYEHIIDYIRIYQTDTVNCQLITAWPQKQETGKTTIFYPDHPVGGAY